MSLVHLIRRSFDSPPTFSLGVGGNGRPDRPRDDDLLSSPNSPLPILVLFLTFFGFYLLILCVNYTYGHVLPTLCMIESPETEAYLPVNALALSGDESTDPPAYEETEADDEADAAPAAGGPKPDDVELRLVRNKPVTASLRASIQHLKRHGGYMARLRGLGLYFLWNFAVNILTAILSFMFGDRPMSISLAATLAELAFATVHMAWIHVVISKPSPRHWWQRIPSFRTWPKIAPAVAVWALATRIVYFLPLLICASFGSLKHMRDPDYNPDKRALIAIGAQSFFGIVLTLMLYVLIQIPASVAMVRVAASMLPEEDETIVAFDRTFGGKTTPTIVGGSGKIGIAEAWRSFPWASRVRLVKMVAKVALLVLTVSIAMVLTLTIECTILSSGALRDFLKFVHGLFGPR